MDRLVLALAALLAAGPVLSPAPARAETPRFTGHRIDLELQAAPLDRVLELFCGIGKVNIVKQGDIGNGPVTVYLKKMRWDEALYRILHAQGLQMVVEGNVIYVRPEG